MASRAWHPAHQATALSAKPKRVTSLTGAAQQQQSAHDHNTTRGTAISNELLTFGGFHLSLPDGASANGIALKSRKLKKKGNDN